MCVPARAIVKRLLDCAGLEASEEAVFERRIACEMRSRIIFEAVGSVDDRRVEGDVGDARGAVEGSCDSRSSV